MKTLAFFFFLLLGHGLLAQNFAPLGATWYYESGYAFSPQVDYMRFEITKDTTIQGRSCRKLEKWGWVGCLMRQGYEYLWTPGDSALFYDQVQDTFFLLYDFGAQVGDNWSLLLPEEMPGMRDTLVVSVDSVGWYQANGQALRSQWVTYLTKGSRGGSFSISGQVVERIGDLDYLLNLTPEVFFICDDNYSRGLRCYADAEFGSYETGLAHRCDSTFVISQDDRQPLPGLAIFPNPTQSELQLHWEESPQVTWSVEIFDLKGKVRAKQSFPAGEGEAHWDVSEWLPGMYLLRIRKTNRVSTYKLMRE